MTLSIIVPIYNAAPFLRRCLDSIPIREDVEVIIIDDASTDGSSGICDEYNFHVVHFPSNRGVSAARNCGIKHADGDFITFLDADDYYTENAIDIMLGAIKDYGADYDMIQFNHYVRRVSGEIATKGTNAHGEFKPPIMPRLFCYVWNKVYKRELIDRLDIKFLSDMHYGEDEIFNLMCLMLTGRLFNHCERTIIHSRENEGSLSRTPDADALVLMANRIAGFLTVDYLPDGMSEMLRQLLANVWDSTIYKKRFGG